MCMQLSDRACETLDERESYFLGLLLPTQSQNLQKNGILTEMQKFKTLLNDILITKTSGINFSAKTKNITMNVEEKSKTLKYNIERVTQSFLKRNLK